MGVTGVEYRPDAPGKTRLRTDAGSRTPTTLLIAGPLGIEEIPLDGVPEEDVGVLIDVPHRRAPVGSTRLLRSTFTRLMFLDDRFSARFQPVEDRTTGDGERVRTWRVW